MIPNFSKIFLVLISFTLFTLFINCGKSVKKAPSELPNKQEKQIDIYSKLDVCGCNKEAIEIIELAKEIITVDGGKRKLEKLGLVAEYKKVNEEESVALGKSLLSKEFFDNQYAMASKKGKSSSKMFWLLSKVQPLLARSL